MPQTRSGNSLRSMSVFFGLAACSWVPHLALHYHRLETKSSLVIGDWYVSRRESYAAFAISLLLVVLNLACIRIRSLRSTVALLSGVGHTLVGGLLLARAFQTFQFLVLDWAWTRGPSLRLALVVLPFGLVSIAIGVRLLFSSRRGS